MSKKKNKDKKSDKKKDSKKKSDVDKYVYYSRAVQSPEADTEFLEKTYNDIRGRKPKTLREDFCGTFLNSCTWAQMAPDKVAHGVDLDPEPIEYGKKNYYPKLNEDQQKRVHIHQANVLESGLPKADVVAALNFSYFIFKERKVLKDYFANVYKTLDKDGIFVMDCFGGSQCYESLEEETEHDDFSYYWDLDSYDPVTNHVQYYIHFKVKGHKKQIYFSYDWRMWAIPELKDILDEVGFKTTVYWEGTTKDGDGDGDFKPVTQGEECEAWIAYLVSEKK